MEDFQQANTNLAKVQSGSAGVERAGYVTGAVDGKPVLFNWEGLQSAWAANNPEFVTYFSHFLGATAAVPSPLQANIGSTGTVTSASSKLIMTTAATNLDWVTVALGLHWLVSNGWTVLEAEFDAPSLAGKSLEIGLSDAVSETAGEAFSNHAAGTDVATNAIVLAYEDGGSLNWLVNYANAGTGGVVDTGVVADTSSHILKIFINSAGDTWVYLDGVEVAAVEEAVSTASLFTLWATVVSAGAVEVLNLDFIHVFGES